MDTIIRHQPTWQGHKYSESIDSELSFFDPSTSSTTDSWSGYFEGWEGPARDSYCPQIASASSSPRSSEADKTPHGFEPEELLPTACPRRQRPVSAKTNIKTQPTTKTSKRTKRYGIVPYADPVGGREAVNQLNELLEDSMSNTEDILAAMYNPDWDAESLQTWYQQSAKSPADLALFKIMFSLRYTIEQPSPIS